MDLFAASRTLEHMGKAADEGEGAPDAAALAAALASFSQELKVVVASLKSVLQSNHSEEPSATAAATAHELNASEKEQITNAIIAACESGDFFGLKDQLETYPSDCPEILELASLTEQFDSSALLQFIKRWQ